MITIEITQEVGTNSTMASVLYLIANMIDDGYMSGHDPDWSLSGEEELDERDADDSVPVNF